MNKSRIFSIPFSSVNLRFHSFLLHTKNCYLQQYRDQKTQRLYIQADLTAEEKVYLTLTFNPKFEDFGEDMYFDGCCYFNNH